MCLTSILCSKLYGHDWLQTCCYKTRELSGLFAEFTEKPVVGYQSYLPFLSKGGLSQMFLYFPPPQATIQLTSLADIFLFDPIFCLFPHFGAWSQAIFPCLKTVFAMAEKYFSGMCTW